MVTNRSSIRSVAAATSAIACSNTSALAREGEREPLSLRTYCVAAARTSSDVAAGSKLWRVWMLLHMPPSYRRLAVQVRPIGFGMDEPLTMMMAGVGRTMRGIVHEDMIAFDM